jgi:hypothetical protein
LLLFFWLVLPQAGWTASWQEGRDGMPAVCAIGLAGPCPLRLVIHIALSDEDQVITRPLVNDLGFAVDKAGNKREGEPLNIRRTFTF